MVLSIMSVMFLSVEIMVFVLLSVAFFSLFERKMMGLIQARKGPSKVGMGGLFQPLADAMKLIMKAEISPSSAIKVLYWMSPVVTFLLSLSMWWVYPMWWSFSSKSVGILTLMVLYSISVYGVIMTGWFSESKYALIGSVRALAQSISYEIGLAISFLALSLILSTFSIEVISGWGVPFAVPMASLMVSLLIVMVAETNRSPFDLAEGESELVSGYCVEYGGLSYTLIYLGENLALVFSSVVVSVIFWSGSVAMMMIIVVGFVIIRSALPRVRYDKVMSLLWVEVLPIQLVSSSVFALIS